MTRRIAVSLGALLLLLLAAGSQTTLAAREVNGATEKILIEGQIGGPVHAVATQSGLVVSGAGTRLAVLRASRRSASGIEPQIPSTPLAERVGLSATLPGVIRSVAVLGDFAYATLGADGLSVVDIQDPAEPTAVGHTNLDGFGWGVAVLEDMALVAAGEAGLLVVGSSDPSAPTVIGSVPTASPAWSVAASETLCAVGTSDGIELVDVSEPTNARSVGQFATDSPVLGVAIEDTLGYLAVEASGLIVVDLSDPTDPALVGNVADPAPETLHVAVDHGTAYLAVGGDGVEIVDVLDPTAPRLTGRFEFDGFVDTVAVYDSLVFAVLPDWGLEVIDARAASGAEPKEFRLAELAKADSWSALSVAVQGTRAIVAAGPRGLRIIDVYDRSSPRELGALPVAADESPSTGRVTDVTLIGSHAYAVGPSGLAVVDVGRPTAPRIVGELGAEWTGARAAAGHEAVYVAAEDDGLHIVDVSDPEEPQLASHLDVDALDVAAGDGLVFVASASAGLLVLDASEPSGARQIGRAPETQLAYRITAAGNLVAVAVAGAPDHPRSAVLLVDVADPFAPNVVGRFDPSDGDIISLELSGAMLYVGLDNGVLCEVDVSEPAAPRKLTEVQVAGYRAAAVHDIVVHDGLLHLAIGSSGLHLYSLAAAEPPQHTGGLAAPYRAIDVHASAELAYGIYARDGLRIHDAIRPTSLPEIGHLQIDDCCLQEVFTTGEHTFVGSSDDDTGLYIIDVSDSAEPKLVSVVAAPVVGPQGLDVSAGHAYAIDGSVLRIVDVRSPSAPVVVAEFESSATALDYAAGYLYLAAGAVGLIVLDVRDATTPVVATTYLPPDGYDAIDTLRVVGIHAYLYATVDDGPGSLRILDIRSPASPHEVGALDGVGDSAGGIWQLDVTSDTCIAVGPGGAVEFIDVSDRTAPMARDRIRVGGSAPVRVHAHENLALLASRGGGLRALSLSGSRPVPALRTWLDATGVALGAGHAYVAAMASFTPVVDTSSPAAPELVSANITGATAVAEAAGRLYASTYAAGFRVHELSEPSAPREVGNVQSYWLPGDTKIVGNVAYVAAEEDGLRVLDISEVGEPHEIGSMAVPGVAASIDVAGAHAFVGTLDAGLIIASTDDPTRPEIVGSYDAVVDVWDVEVVGDVAYLAAADEGLVVLDVSAPSDPRPLGVLPIAEVIGLDVVGRFVYLASPSLGLAVVDVSQPSSPALVAQSPLKGVAQAVAVRGTLAYVAALDTGLWLLRLDPRLSSATLFLPAVAAGPGEN